MNRGGPESSRAQAVTAWAGMTLVLALAAFLRLFRLGSKPLWLGEAQEIVAARSDRFFAQILNSGTDVVGFFWHHLVWLWRLEPIEAWSRAAAAACGICAVAVTYALGKRLHSRTAGLSAAALLAVSFFHVYHSQDARSLSYLTCFYALAWLSMSEAFFFGKWRYAPLFSVAAGLTGLSHSIGGLYLVLQGAFFLLVALWPELARLARSLLQIDSQARRSDRPTCQERGPRKRGGVVVAYVDSISGCSDAAGRDGRLAAAGGYSQQAPRARALREPGASGAASGRLHDRPAATGEQGPCGGRSRLLRYLLPALGALPICALQFYVVADYAFAFQVTRNPVVHVAEWQDLFLLKLYGALLAGGNLPAGIVLGGLALAGVVALWKRDGWRAQAVLVWLAGPVVMLYGIMTFGNLARFELYHLLPTVVPFVLAAGVGLAAAVGALRRRLRRGRTGELTPAGESPEMVWALLVALSVGGLGSSDALSRYFQRDTRLFQGEDARRLADYLAGLELGKRDIVLTNYSEHLVPLNFYAGSDLRKATVVVPWKPPDRRWQYHLLARAHFQATESDIERLLPEEIRTVEELPGWDRTLPARSPGDRIGHGHGQGHGGGRVICLLFWPMSAERRGYGDLYDWLVGESLYVRHGAVRREDVPPGFRLHRYEGVDVLEAPASSTMPAEHLVGGVLPLLLANAPPLLRDMAPEVYVH